jgi:hypothetical protein
VSTQDTAGEIVVETVARCRRRIQLVAAARRAALTIPLAIVGVELVTLAMRLPAARFVILTATAGAMAAIAAAIPSVMRAPSMRATAAAIDGRLQLQDRIVTALQLVDESDQMARLVVRDAGAHLSAMSPSRAFPFEAPSHFGATLMATVAVTIVFLVIARAPAGSWLAARGGSSVSTGAGAGRSVRSAKPGSNARIVDGVAPSASEAPRRTSPPMAASREDIPAGRESKPNDADTRALGRGANEPRAVDPGPSTSGRDAGNAAGMRDGGRGAAGFTERMAPAAGGVNGALASIPRPAPGRAAVAAAPGNAAYRDEYRMAAARAQTAIAQERVPARLRTYVRRYFVAIHP